MFYSLGHKNIWSGGRRPSAFTICEPPRAIPFPSYGLCSGWHGGEGDVHMSHARETGELLKSAGRGGKGECAAQLASGLAWEAVSTKMWGDGETNEDSPLCSAIGPPLSAAETFWVLGTPKPPHKWVKKKDRVSCCSATEPGRRVHASPLKVQHYWCAPEPAKPTTVLGISQDRTQPGKRGLGASGVTQHLPGRGPMLLLGKQLHSTLCLHAA